MDQVDGVNQIMTHIKANKYRTSHISSMLLAAEIGADDIGVDVGLYCK